MSDDIAQLMQQLQQSSAQSMPESASMNGLLPNGKKTKGRVKIKMEYIGNKLRRYTTFSKRKTGIMKKAYELSTLTGTQVMLMVASETGHVYTFATKKLQPMISSDTGRTLIQTCLNSPGGEQGTDLQPSRTEFTFETGNPANNPRKRKMNDGDSSAAIASLLPTMVPTPLFSSVGEDDYEDESGDDTDSEEPSEGKEEGEVEVKREKRDEIADVQQSLQQTLKDALKAAANNRQQQQKKKNQTTHSNAFLAPFLLSGLTNASTANNAGFPFPNLFNNQNGSSTSLDGGASANKLFMNSPAGEEASSASNPMMSFPFQFNLQQLMESAVLGAQITNTE